MTSFSGSIFINNAIAGALEAPSYALCFLCVLWARTKSLMILLILAGASCLLYLAVPQGWCTVIGPWGIRSEITEPQKPFKTDIEKKRKELRR